MPIQVQIVLLCIGITQCEFRSVGFDCCKNHSFDDVKGPLTRHSRSVSVALVCTNIIEILQELGFPQKLGPSLNVKH